MKVNCLFLYYYITNNVWPTFFFSSKFTFNFYIILKIGIHVKNDEHLCYEVFYVSDWDCSVFFSTGISFYRFWFDSDHFYSS